MNDQTETGTAQDEEGCPHFRSAADCEECWRETDNEAEITDLVKQADAAIATAVLAIQRTRTAVAGLVSSRVYDVEMAEVTSGQDALAELDRAAISARHVQRIIADRKRLMED